MRQENCRWLTCVCALILLMAISGCDASRQASRPSLREDGRFMDMWKTYTHCSRSEDLDAVRMDAHRLSISVGAVNPPADSIPPTSNESSGNELPSRLSVDPAAMAAACAVHVGQVAQGTGHPSVAQEMFQMVIINFPQPPYRYYVAQAKQGLERLQAANRVTFRGHSM